MKEFDIIRLLFIAIPAGMFATYGIFWAIILSLKVKNTEDTFRKLMSLYCLFAGITGLMLIMFYFLSDTFFQLNILYCILAAYTMITFYHFLYHAAKLKKDFNFLHYLPPLLVGIGLLIFRIISPEDWINYGNDISLGAALVFGIIYTALPLYEMYKFQLALAVQLGTSAAIDNSKGIPFVCEILLYPVASILLPLVGGSEPSIYVSILLMLSCLLALAMNIPLTYALMRHYVGSSFSNISLFEASMLPAPQPTMIERMPVMQEQEHEQDEAETTVSKRVYRKYSSKQIKDGQLIELDKKVFDSYFRKHKPFLNPQLTIVDLVEPLESNRTYISKFVNQVYGMSFSSYMNLCRLHEMRRLQALPSNKGKSEAELCLKAGFGKYRNYLYVKKQFSTVLNSQTDVTDD
ncbi:hypothetical protein JGH11_07910 [Dysgonomonas sp. Marseille-P4677]|uniref:hypothetical protein n=1 Tax=Dysgonomonas sp. Marseille-P4677 TaxID=2364790 RepID=UPI001912B9B9|nr:hypothetical protein [Dysgonomonas sp. Marseille-P4677]MBK5720796.1 hypothetical protein [Dysgonomonas sp. Marseille-P4677]